MTALPNWVGVDWGTSNLRLWGMDNSDSVLFERSSDQGMSKLRPEEFAPVLEHLLEAVVPADAPPIDVVVCGMAGAKQGWREAGYYELPADLGQLGDRAVTAEVSGASRLRPVILAGLCQRVDGVEDVMRGEETQLLGLTALRPGFSGAVCMPGTHSKWIQIEGTKVTRFSTVMTGELYDVLSTHSVLRHSFNGELIGPNLEDGIEAGLTLGLSDSGRLTSHLFTTRAASLLSGRTADWCSGYLSGLLVGAEVAGYQNWFGPAPVALIGSDRLMRLYSRALEKAEQKSETIDAARATIAGLSQARKQIAHG